MNLIILIVASARKVWAYRRAGWAIDELVRNITAIYEKGGVEELQTIPGIGPGLATFIAESLSESRFEQAK